MKPHQLAVFVSGLVFGLCLTGTLPAQVINTPLAERVRATFRATDLDKNGTISPREAAKAGVPARSFAKYDKNKDRRLASDEFQAYYQNLILKSRSERAKREAKRKEAEEKRQAELAKKKAAEAKKVKPIPANPGAKPPVPGESKAVKQETKPGTTKPSPVTPAPANTTPAVQAPVNPPPANPAPANPKVDPVSQKSKKDGAKDGAKKSDADWLKDEQAARASVQRVLAKGQVSAKEANQLYKALTINDVSVGASIREWRAALNTARDKVTALVRSGALDAAEGRAMYNLFEERARRAVANLVPEPETKPKGDAETKKEEGKVGTDRATKPKRGPTQKPAQVSRPGVDGKAQGQKPGELAPDQRKPELSPAEKREAAAKAAKRRESAGSQGSRANVPKGTLRPKGNPAAQPQTKPQDPATADAKRTSEARGALSRNPKANGTPAKPSAEKPTDKAQTPVRKPTGTSKAKPGSGPKVVPKAGEAKAQRGKPASKPVKAPDGKGHKPVKKEADGKSPKTSDKSKPNSRPN